MNNINNLQKWTTGDVITANRLNEMICKINCMSFSSNALDETTTNSYGGGISSDRGIYNRNLCRMWPEDGNGRIIDGYIMPKIGENQGFYARNNGVTAFDNSYYPLPSLDRIADIEAGGVTYQKIEFDKKGNITNTDIYYQATDESMNLNRLWKYGDCGHCGVLYHRLNRIVTDCRVKENVPVLSKKITTIKTNDFFMPPMVQNSGECGTPLLAEIDGNTLPLKTVQANEGTRIKEPVTCNQKYIEIVSGVTFQSIAAECSECSDCSDCSITYNYDLCMPTCAKVEWKGYKAECVSADGSCSHCYDTSFGFKIIPNQCYAPYKFTIQPYGSPYYKAGCAIDDCLLTKCKTISVLPANSKTENSCAQSGYLYEVVIESEAKNPYIKDGSLRLPPSGYCAGDAIDKTQFINNKYISVMPANSGNKQKGYVYDIVEESAITKPVIENGVIYYPPIGCSGCSINYSAGDGIDSTDLANKKISVLPANSATMQKGYVYGVMYSNCVSCAQITCGIIQIPQGSEKSGINCVVSCESITSPNINGNTLYLPKNKVVQYYDGIPESGICDWSLSFYMEGACSKEYRQLMRFKGADLQVSFQSRQNGGQWSIADMSK